MILFIIGALFVLIALAILIFSDDAKRTAIIPAVVAVIFIGISCVSYVPTGYTGIVTTFGKVEDGTKDAGVVLKAPWQSIVKMDNRVQEMSMDLSAFSSDIQEVSTSVAVGYRINQANAMTIYKEVGKKYEDTLITPRVLETVKAVVAHYDTRCKRSVSSWSFLSVRGSCSSFSRMFPGWWDRVALRCGPSRCPAGVNLRCSRCKTGHQ